MPNWYVDHDNTALYPSAYMATPSGPSQLPQEGDGAASGTGTTPAVAMCSVVFTGSPSGRNAGNLTVLGAVVTPSYSDTNDTQANNLATAINASTAAVTFPSKAGNISSVYLKAVVWARGPSGGAAAGTCEIYSRIATDAFNGQAISIAAWNGGGTVTKNDWNSNGVSGPWRYFANTAALALVNATVGDAVMEYGAVIATTMGTPAAGDKLYVRSKRSGANINITLPNSGWTATVRPGGTALNRVQLIVDDGAVWSGDSGVFTLTFTTGNVTETISFPTTTYWHWKGVDLGSDTRNFKLVCQARGSLYYYPSLNIINFPHILENVEVDTPDNNASGRLWFGDLTPTASAVGQRALFKALILRARSAVGGFFPLPRTFGRQSYEISDCKFFYTNQAGANTRFLVHPYDITNYGVGGYSCKIKLTRCTFSGLASPTGAGNTIWPAGQSVMGSSSMNAGGLDVQFEDCDLTNATLEGMVQVNMFEKYTNCNFISAINSTSERTYKLDRADGYREWAPGQGFPTLSESVLPDGTAWSIRCCPLPAATDFSSAMSFECPPLSKLNTLADGARTATLQFCVDDDIKTAAGGTLTSADFGVRATWTAADGTLKSADTLTPNAVDASALAAGSTAWSTGNPPTYGSTGNFTAYKIDVSMASVRENTNITLQLVCTRAGATRSQFFFVSPEFALS